MPQGFNVGIGVGFKSAVGKRIDAFQVASRCFNKCSLLAVSGR